MKDKGFTLIELLGVIIILSLIMLIAIPNITSTLDRSKKEQYLVDAKKLISQVEYELRKGEIDKPGTQEIVKITLGYLGTNDIEYDADNNKYDTENSYVIVFRNEEKVLTYYVNLVTKLDNNKYKGIKLVDSECLTYDSNTSNEKCTTNKYNLVKSEVQLLSRTEIRNMIGITKIIECTEENAVCSEINN